MQFRIPDPFIGKGLSDDVHRLGAVFGVFERKANLRRLIAERIRHRQRYLLGRNVTNVDNASSAHEITHVATVIGDADAELLCHCNARSLSVDEDTELKLVAQPDDCPFNSRSGQSMSVIQITGRSPDPSPPQGQIARKLEAQSIYRSL